MSAWIIYDKSGSAKCEVRRLEYSGEFLGACSVSVSISSPNPISFEIGDWLEYRGERFELNYDPSVVKESSAGTHGEGFVYEDVLFNSLSDELTRCDFLDYVPSDNLIHYSSLPNFSFFADSIEKLAERIKVNLDRVYTGEKAWTVEVHPEYVNKGNVNISVSSINCWDALALVKTEFDANFIIRNRTIVIGTEGIAVSNVFSYGKGNGLISIEQNAESNQKIITRLRAYGSTRNMPPRYYSNIEAGAPNNLAVNNLMLPSFPSETLDPYIDSENVGVLGVREGTVFFDGSGDLEEIYPSMEGMTAEDLTAAGVPVSATGALDEVVSAEQIADDGIYEEGDTIPTFTITLKDIGFDLNEYLGTSSASISMKNGMCGGRDFEIVACEMDGNNYVLTCNRAYDDGLDLYFPYIDYQIASGDKFVLLNIEMPDVYIKAASQRLLTAAKAYLAKNDYVRYSYTPKVDSLFMARQHDEALKYGLTSIHDTLKEGDILLFEDDDLKIEGSVIVDSLRIVEDSDDSLIPSYEITLKNDKTVGTIDKIQNQIDSIVSGKTGVGGGGGYNASQIKSLILAYGGRYFLRKDKDDRSAGLVASDKGFEVGEYVSGASGAIIYKDSTNGQTVGEMDKLYIRMKAYFETLEIINVNTVGGKQILSPAGSVKCIGVETLDSAYRCYFLGEQDGEVIENRFVIGDQGFSQMFNAKEGVSNKVSNHYYWRLVTGVSEEVIDYNNQKCHYIDLSIADCDTGSDIPKAGDIINQRGNRTDVDRMNFIEWSAVDAFSPNVTLFHGVNSYSLDGKAYVSFGVDKTTNKAFMNVYGEMYVGDRNETSYMRYTQEGGLEISGTLSVETKLGDSTLKDLISASTPEGYQEFVDKVTQDLEGLQQQIDGAIESFFYQYDPSLSNYPASEWVAEGTESLHLNDTFTNLSSGRSWRWTVANDVYGWTEITDTATTQALALAGQAKDTADGKRRVFVATPYPPYDEGDLWSRGSEYPLMICVVSKASGVYAESDWDYADNNAKLLEEMESLVQDTKDELNNSIGQATEAANKYTDTAKTELQGVINELNSAKANINDVYTKSEADGIISDAEQSAIDAAKAQADAAIALSETTIKAYADGVVTEEEAARIKQAQENLEAAKAYADEKVAEAFDEISSFDYLKEALKENTSITGGLIQTSLVSLGYTNAASQLVTMSGINGLYNSSLTGGGIATFWGGGMYDLADYYTWNGSEWVIKSGVTAPANIPSGLIRFDGTGYFANGKFWWDSDGEIHADPTALLLSFDATTGDETLASTIIDIRKDIALLNSMWEKKTDSNGNEYLYTTKSVVTQLGVTMYSDATTLDVDGIYDALPVDGTSIYWENGVLKANSSGSTTKHPLSWSGFSSGSYDGSVAQSFYIPTKLSEFVNDKSFATTSDLSGYLPLSGGTLSNSYEPLIVKRLSDTGASFIRYHNNEGLIGTIGIGGSASSFLYDIYFQNKNGSSYKIWHSGNDGAGSGLDADTLDGIQLWDGTRYFNVVPFVRNNGEINVGTAIDFHLNTDEDVDYSTRLLIKEQYKNNVYLPSTSGTLALTTDNVASATKLETPRTIWGQSFDGSEDISGDLTLGNGKIYGCTNASILYQASGTKNVLIGYDTASQGYSTYINGHNISLRYGTNRTGGLYLNSSGNVLIGTETDSGYKLDVNGSARFIIGYSSPPTTLSDLDNNPHVFHLSRGSSNNYGLHVYNLSSGVTYLQSGRTTAGNVEEFPMAINYLGGNVLIGETSDKGYKLHVAGDIYSSANIRADSSLFINGIELKKSQNDVLYIDGNLVVRGGVTMYGENEVDIPTLMDAIAVDATMYNEGGILGVVKASTTKAGAAMFDSNFFSVDDNGLVTLTNAPSSVSTLGSLLNVDVSLDSTATVDRVLYQPTGSSTWTWKELTSSGVVGDYLPLSGGTLTSNNSSILTLDSSNSYGGYLTFKQNGTYRGSVGYVNGADFIGNGVFLFNDVSSKYITISNSGQVQVNAQLRTIINENTSNNIIFKFLNYEDSPYGLISRIYAVGNVSLQVQRESNDSELFSLILQPLGGNVGIGTTSPSAKLSVNGSTNFNGTITLEDAAYFLGSPTYGVRFNDHNSNYNNFIIYENGNTYTRGSVGIGMTSPIYKLDIQETANNDYGLHYYNSANHAGFYVGNSALWYGNANNGDSLLVRIQGGTNADGSGGIIALNLTGNGNLKVAGGITMYSDIRKKQKLQDVELSLSQIANAPLIEHYYKSDQAKTTHVGSIAQYWAGLNDWFCKLDNEGYYTMEIQNAALASAISVARHLERYETKTDKKIRQLKKRISQLEDELDNLKKGV